MRLLVLGRGKTGTLVAEIARERGHSVEVLGSADNVEASALTPERLANSDVIIDFTTPASVPANVTAALTHGARIVVGTTGWYTHLPALTALAHEHNGSLLYGTNFSIGVQAFFRAARALAESLREYHFSIRETHHVAKKDAPSGTALTLQKIVTQALKGGEVGIASTREGDVPGLHTLEARSANDRITLQHDAVSRRGFAEGAVRAAEWLAGQAAGVWDFADVSAELDRIKVGSRVRIVKIPESVEDGAESRTRTLLQQCLGKTFLVSDIHGHLLAIDVGDVLGQPPYLETVYIEPFCVEVVS